MTFVPSETYVRLGGDGNAHTFAGGDAFWNLAPAEVEKIAAGWMIAEFTFDRDWPNWEMHPNADEFVYLLAGHVELLLDRPGGQEIIELRERRAVLVPRGVWHTAIVHAPSTLLHVTLGAGTEQR